MTQLRPDHVANFRRKFTVVAAMVGMGSREFGTGWAEGMARWRRRWHVVPADLGEPRFEFAESAYPPGSIAFAASEAAVTFMRERRGAQ